MRFTSRSSASAKHAHSSQACAAARTHYQTKKRSPQDPVNFPIRLNDKRASVAESASMGDFAPTAQHRAVYAQLVEQIDAQLAQLRALWETDLPALNTLIKESSVAAVK